MYRIRNIYNGRISQRNYIFGQLFIWLVSGISFVFANTILVLPEQYFLIGVIFSILGLILIVSCIVLSWALHIRRFHDLGLSGYYTLLFFIPLVNLLILVLFFKKGEGDNQFGKKSLENINFFDALFNKS